MQAQSYEELCGLWVPKYGVDIGVSDSALANQVSKILSHLKPRTLIVDRPKEDAILSFASYMRRACLDVDFERCRQLADVSLKALDAVRGNPLVKSVQFDDLRDYNVMLACMEWLLPNRDFPDLKTLMDFDIQVSAHAVKKMPYIQHTLWHLKA
jgi:hypothetical protein